MRTIRIGSRESRLAVIQSETVLHYLEEQVPEVCPELVPMKTTGDMILDRSLEAVGGKGLFVRELDRALREGRSDLSVHSLKDVPMEVPEDLPLLGFSRREDPRDALVLPKGAASWDRRLPVGCSSRRRRLQLQRLAPDVTFAPVRGNVQTRLAKLDAGEYGALILAAAGLRRLGLAGRISHLFSVEEMIPAAGQGILAVQGRAGEDYSFLEGYFCEEERTRALAERAFVRRLDGGCSSPIAAYAWVQGDALTLRGLYYSEDKKDFVTGTLTGNCREGEYLGAELAERLRRQLDG